MESSTQEFLSRVAGILAKLETETVRQDRPLLASLIGLARDEAEDDLRTSAAVDQTFSAFQRASSRNLLAT